MVHFFSVSHFVVVINEAHNCSVIRILDDMVGDVIRRAVVCHQGEQQGAQNAALWATSVQGDDTRVVFFNLCTDWVLSERKVQQQVTEGCVETQGTQLAYQVLAVDHVEC